MKKTLSILLSLLMILGTITCMFTVPVSAEEVADPVANAAESTTEELPENLFTKSTPMSGEVLTKDSNNTFGFGSGETYEAGTAAIFDVKWAGKSRMLPNRYHQLTFTVKVSDTISENVYIYPGIQSNATAYEFTEIVGVRTDLATGATETVLNHTVPKVDNANPANSVITKFDKDVTAQTIALEAGKTYSYTYVFYQTNEWINKILIHAKGLGENDSLTFSDGNLFDLTDTEWSNFVWNGASAVRYMVKENDNVFQRIYGYRAIGDTEYNTVNVTLNAKKGGDYYDILFKGGNTYNFDFKFRILTPASQKPIGDVSYSPNYQVYETGLLDYTEEYKDIKDPADTKSFVTTTNTADKIASGGNIGFGDGQNPYAYSWAGSGSNTFIRRLSKNKNVKLTYTKDGAVVSTVSDQATGVGRDIRKEANFQAQQGQWLDVNYSIYAMGAQTKEEASILGSTGSTKSNHDFVRYHYNTATGKWDYHPDNAKGQYKNGSIYVSAAQDATVAFAIAGICEGFAYDFDNITVRSDFKEIPVKVENLKGQEITLDTACNATSYYDVKANKTIANIDVLQNEIYSFKGWYDGDEFVSNATELETSGEYANLKAVVVSKNVLSSGGGFENLADGGKYENTSLNINAADYANYTGHTFRYYTTAPTGHIWNAYTTFGGNLQFTDTDNGVALQSIRDKITNAGGKIYSDGVVGTTHFAGFPQSLSSKAQTYYTDSGKDSSKKQTITVHPYNGNRMMRLAIVSRNVYRELDNLEAGKVYTLSMYVYNVSNYDFLRQAWVSTSYTSDATGGKDGQNKILGKYTAPYTIGNETYIENGQEKTRYNVNNLDDSVLQKWVKVSFDFIAESDVAYLGMLVNNHGYTDGAAYIDELTVVEKTCENEHTYTDDFDTNCNVCNQARELPTSWDFEDGKTNAITASSGAELQVVDAENQAGKIGSKYLQYTNTPGAFGFAGMAVNFKYEQGYKYKLSYDMKIFTYGGDDYIKENGERQINANGLEHNLVKFNDGKFSDNAGSSTLVSGYDIIVTRYWENGAVYKDARNFSHAGNGENNFFGRDNIKTGELDSAGNELMKYGKFTAWGGDIFEEWQHIEIEIDPEGTDYEGLVEYGIRPNGRGWVIGFDNFKVEKVAVEVIDEADDATNGTYAFSIRAKTENKKQGLRFKSTINLSAFQNAKVVEYGTLATIASNLQGGRNLTREIAKDKAQDGYVVQGVAYDEANEIDARFDYDANTNTVTYTGVLVGIGVSNYDVDFAVRGYVVVELADGTRVTVYDDVVTISVFDAATQIVEESDNDDDKAAAQKVLDDYAQVVAQ